ncbi:hypothetical protein EYF80_046054 [Liparis tanakae]|uniref:Uncharacterized protein n=1 Tax=Liparis tanakae TaxID=230148 RepID=A0A4Z2FS49_9TELE|nr:hypothetical protein EYF80_046054 [Liparis tanakae]
MALRFLLALLRRRCQSLSFGMLFIKIFFPDAVRPVPEVFLVIVYRKKIISFQEILRALLTATCSVVSPLRSFCRTSAPCLSSSRTAASSPRLQAKCSGLLSLLPWEKFRSRSRCFRRYDFSFSRPPSSTYFHTRFCLRDNMRTQKRTRLRYGGDLSDFRWRRSAAGPGRRKLRVLQDAPGVNISSYHTVVRLGFRSGLLLSHHCGRRKKEKSTWPQKSRVREEQGMHLGPQLLSHLGGQRLRLCLLRGQGAGGTRVQGLLQVEQAQALRSEAQVEEGVEEGVQAAVDVGQAGGVGVSQQQEAQEGASGGKPLQVGEGVSALHNVEGHPAGGKHHHQRGDDLQQPPLPLVLFAQGVEVTGDGAADEAVAHHHRQEREQKAQS